MFEKHLCKSDILSEDAGHRPASLLKNVTLPHVFFKHFASKNQQTSFYISGTLVENGLNWEIKKMVKLGFGVLKLPRM